MLIRKELSFQTKKGPYFVDITDKVQSELGSFTGSSGLVNLFLTGTTASLFINENEPGLLDDIKNLFFALTNQASWKHDHLSSEGNAHAHLSNILTNPELTVPYENGRLILGTWQRIFLAEWDVRPRQRKIIMTVISAEV